jgi:hypothetical protein
VEPVLGDYLDNSGLARHATHRVASDALRLAFRARTNRHAADNITAHADSN